MQICLRGSGEDAAAQAEHRIVVIRLRFNAHDLVIRFAIRALEFGSICHDRFIPRSNAGEWAKFAAHRPFERTTQATATGTAHAMHHC